MTATTEEVEIKQRYEKGERESRGVAEGVIERERARRTTTEGTGSGRARRRRQGRSTSRQRRRRVEAGRTATSEAKEGGATTTPTHHHHTTHHPAQSTERTEPGLGNCRELKHERTPAYEPTLTATHSLGGFQERTHKQQTAAEPEGLDCEAGSNLRGSDWTESLGRERLLF